MRIRDFLRRPLVIVEEITLAVQLVALFLFLRAAAAWAQYDQTFGPSPYQQVPSVFGMTPTQAFVVAVLGIMVPAIVTVVGQLITLWLTLRTHRVAAESVEKTVEGNAKVDELKRSVNGQTERLVDESGKRGHAEGFREGGEFVRQKQAEHAATLATGQPVALAVPVVLAPGGKKPDEPKN